ncbi:hypothetical protein [Catenulispora pinisilvae]|uniref:hypothetical protein n=1 Tax=Catenulispora pinisilvae TaxID=2705253 RepID=UPI0018928616|nr:hypothetical protein [Catenulispora pinisilvae]
MDTTLPTTVAQPQPDPVDEQPPLRRRGIPRPVIQAPRAVWIAALVAAAWLLPVLTHLLHADIVLLPVILLAVASLMTAGHTLLDRLMFAVALLAGVLIAAGLLFSVWPWGLNPVPVTGTLLTGTVAVGAVLDRRPRLPRRVLASDLLVLAAPVLSYRVLDDPYAGKNFIQAIPFTSSREDPFNHFSLFDAIRHVGGFTFLHGGAAAKFTISGNQYSYPSGSHFLYALIDVFRRSTTSPDSSYNAFGRYHQYEIIGMAFTCMAIVWAARWIAGPAMTGWRRVLICGTVGGLAVYGDLTTLYWQGFDSEVLSLGLLALATAILVRPPRRVREQMLLIGSLVVSLSFTYSLYPAFLVIGIVVAVAVHRRRVLRHWVFALVVAVVAVPIAYIPYWESAHHSTVSAGPLFLQGGSYWGFSRAASVGFALLAMSGLATRAGRRSPAWWVLTGFVGLSCLVAVYTEWYGRSHIGQPGYYSSKMVEAAWVITLCGFGAVGLFLKPGQQTKQRRLGSRRLTELPAAAAALVAALIFTRAVPLVPADWQWGQTVPSGLSTSAVWSNSLVISGWAKPTTQYAKALPVGDGVPTVTIFSDTAHDNRHLTMFLAMLNGDLGEMDVDWLGGHGIDNLASVKLDSKGQMPAKDKLYLSRLEQYLEMLPTGVRVVVSNQAVANYLSTFAGQNPQLRLSVVYLPHFNG